MSHYKQTNYYFDTLVAAAIYKIRNPWDMRQVIASITQPQMSPPMLCRQTRCDKFDQYDKRGLVLHKQVSISDGKPVAKKIKSPYNKSTNAKDNAKLYRPMPDDFLMM